MTVIVADRFPVKLLGPDGAVTHAKAKVVLTKPDEQGTGRLLAWTSPDHPVYDVPFERDASTIGNKGTDWWFDTSIGRIGVRSAGGCGCGDRLKGWHPPELTPYQLGRL